MRAESYPIFIILVVLCLPVFCQTYDEAIKAYNPQLTPAPTTTESPKPDVTSPNTSPGQQNATVWFNEGLALANQGKALDDHGKYDEAIQDFNQAIELNQSFAKAWYYKGLVLMELGKYNEALLAFNKAIEIKPNYMDAWDGKGFALLRLGRNAEADAAHAKSWELEKPKPKCRLVNTSVICD